MWMTVADTFSNSMTLTADLSLALLAFCIFLFAVLIRKKTQKRMAGIESRIESLVSKQNKKYAQCESSIASLKTEFFLKAQSLSEEIDSVSRRIHDLFENDEQLRHDLEEKLVDISEALKTMDAKIAALEDSLHRKILEEEEEIEGMMRDLNSFSEDNRKIKDFIRERTIDLEL